MSRCKHTRTRGIYGDEIWTTLRRVFWPERWGGSQIARVRCLDCGRALYDRALSSGEWESRQLSVDSESTTRAGAV